MADILSKYGIKEVADVVFYELDSKGAPSAPVLYLDSLKVSTIEQSAEVIDATGGKGNVKLISWDTNKEITATFEDALFSVKSLAIMFGGKVNDHSTDGKQEVLKTVLAKQATEDGDNWKVNIGRHTVTVGKAKATYFAYDDNGEVQPASATKFDFMTFDLLDSEDAGVKGLTIDIDANTFGGTYYITGDTYARNQESLKDEYFQFIIPKGKISVEDLSLTMEADGDPSTFNMTVNAMRANDGSMIKLVKYTIGEAGQNVPNKGVASVLSGFDKADVENAGYSTSPAASMYEGSAPHPNAFES